MRIQLLKHGDHQLCWTIQAVSTHGIPSFHFISRHCSWWPLVVNWDPYETSLIRYFTPFNVFKIWPGTSTVYLCHKEINIFVHHFSSSSWAHCFKHQYRFLHCFLIPLCSHQQYIWATSQLWGSGSMHLWPFFFPKAFAATQTRGCFQTCS